MPFCHPHIRGTTLFLTARLARRGTSLLTDEVGHLRAAVRDVLRKRWFHIDAFVILPDHLHAVWTLPEDEPDAAERWGDLQAQFTRRLRRAGPARGLSQGATQGLRQGMTQGAMRATPAQALLRALGRAREGMSAKAMRQGTNGIWSRRIERRVVADADDYAALLRTCWQDPVKHGLASCAEDWPFSSIHRDIKLAGGRPCHALADGGKATRDARSAGTAASDALSLAARVPTSAAGAGAVRPTGAKGPPPGGEGHRCRATRDV
ncbi:REP-associated tyrosine transposase [Roseivivax sp. CAU 1753]